jgi:hypothetical protein
MAPVTLFRVARKISSSLPAHKLSRLARIVFDSSCRMVLRECCAEIGPESGHFPAVGTESYQSESLPTGQLRPPPLAYACITALVAVADGPFTH